MKGYLGRPDGTAAMIDEEGWLHTGDVGRVDADGWLLCRRPGQGADQVQGLPGAARPSWRPCCSPHPRVADAAVIGVADEDGNEVPKAYVVPQPGAALDRRDVIAHVAERVAPYKKVRRVEFTDAIPRAASGKILRRELRAREGKASR